MLKRIHIEGYKSFKKLELKLEPLSVLLGPNAAGKSNFFDALQLLSRLATARTLKEAFDPPYRGLPLESFTFGPNALDDLRRQEKVSLYIEADIDLSDASVAKVNRQILEMKRSDPDSEVSDARKDQTALVREKALRYRVQIEMLPKSGILRVSTEYLTALNDKGEPTKKRRPFLEQMTARRLHLRMEGQAHPTYYERFLDHTILSKPLYPPHYPHVVALKEELSSWLFFYFEPRERMRAPSPVKEVRHIGLYGEELSAFLNTLKAHEPKQFDALEKALHALIPSITSIIVDVNQLGEVEVKLREGNREIPSRLVSEGTLRILGLLALGGVKEQPGLIAFEEPENGINPRRIRMVSQLLSTRVKSGNTQIIVTTHSPLLPDLLNPKSLFVCRKRDGYTDIVPLNSWGPLAYRSTVDSALDAEESELKVSERVLRGDFDA